MNARTDGGSSAWWRRFADGALEFSIVGSFTRFGLLARRGLFDWEQSAAPPDLSGRVIVVTGATSGLGLEAARSFAGRGARVHLVGRDAGRLDRAVATLRRDTGSEMLATSVADMGELDQVRTLAGELRSRYQRLDVLVHNAGALSATRLVNSQGVEATVASQVLGPFLLTDLLLPLLERTPGARVITVASGGMYAEKLDVDRLIMGPGEYRGSTAYARAKRAQVALNQEWASRTEGSGVTFHAMHPGWADTPGVAKSLPRFRRILGRSLRSPAEGADTIVWLAISPEVLESNGLFWHDRAPRSTSYLPGTSMAPGEKARLWDWVRDEVYDAADPAFVTAPSGRA